MNRITIILAGFLFASVIGSSQELQFQNGQWAEILSLAKETNKPIFVDFYTDWCLPCRKMDKLVFTDENLAKELNTDFISYKANAEDDNEGTLLAQQYDVGTYPSFIFLHPKGHLLIQTSGFKSVGELIQLIAETHTLIEHYEWLQSIQQDLDKIEPSKLEEILTISKNHSFPGKIKIIGHFLNQKEALAEKDLTLIMNDVYHFDLELLDRIIPITTGLSYEEILVRRNPKQRMQWKNDTQTAVRNFIQKSIKKGDYDMFNQSIESQKLVGGLTDKDIDWLYFDFYRSNDLEQFKAFATYMIAEYISPVSPQKVKQNDLEKYRILHSDEMNKMAKDFFGSSNLPDNDVFSSGQDISKTPTIDSLSEIYTIGHSIADRLYGISSDFFAFYDDETSIGKAEKWAEMAYSYYPYDLKYYENHITILYKLGWHTEIEKVKRAYENLAYYDEMKLKKAQAARAMLYSPE